LRIAFTASRQQEQDKRDARNEACRQARSRIRPTIESRRARLSSPQSSSHWLPERHLLLEAPSA
jgi:hypothetical protein